MNVFTIQLSKGSDSGFESDRVCRLLSISCPLCCTTFQRCLIRTQNMWPQSVSLFW